VAASISEAADDQSVAERYFQIALMIDRLHRCHLDMLRFKVESPGVGRYKCSSGSDADKNARPIDQRARSD